MNSGIEETTPMLEWIMHEFLFNLGRGESTNPITAKYKIWNMCPQANVKKFSLTMNQNLDGITNKQWQI